MTLLALNTVLPLSMRGRYQLMLGALPLGLMFGSFALLWPFASWLAAALGIPPNAPVKLHPNGITWISVFLAMFVALMLIGYAAGWIANALVSRYVFRWSPEKVRAVYLKSEVPVHWLKADANTSGDAAAQSIEKWEKQRELGALRFIATRGVAAWGAPMFLAMHLVPTLVKGLSISIDDLLFNVALWGIAGAAFGAAIWYSSESNYRKLKRRSNA